MADRHDRLRKAAIAVALTSIVGLGWLPGPAAADEPELANPATEPADPATEPANPATEPATPEAADAIADAELAMVERLNDDRRAAGLRPTRIDAALMSIAKARSFDMATRHYFDHRQPDGRDVFDLLDQADVEWTLAGEVIAWNTYPSVSQSLQVAHDGWLASSGHRQILLGSSYNRIGIGLAWDSSLQRWLWTGVLIEGPATEGLLGLVGISVRGEPPEPASATGASVVPLPDPGLSRPGPGAAARIVAAAAGSTLGRAATTPSTGPGSAIRFRPG